MKKTMKHLKKWWRVPLLLLVCLFVGSGNLLAFQETYNESINEIYFTDSRFTDVTVRPNATTPYYEMAMVYYDWSTNHNCFWKSAPQIWVDDVKVCDGTKVGSFYDDGWGAGQDACDAAYNTNYDLADNNNKWWQYSQYTDSNTGIVYTVCFHSPWESNTKSNYRIFSCKMRVYISSMEANSQHKVTIKGTWCYNVKLGHAEKTVDVNKSWTFDAPNPFGNATPTKAEMTGYNTVKVKGDLNGNTGPTKVAIKSSEGAAPTVTNDHRSHNYMDPGSVTPYDKGVTSYSGLTGTYNRQDESQYNGSALGVEYVQTLVNHNVTTNYYKWYSVDVPGFAKATDLSAVDNKWTKSIVLKWNADDANGRSKEGKWYVYRGNDMIASDINYGSGLRDYTDQSDTLTYEVGYDYTVAFVPKDTPTGMRISSLETTINGVTISRNWSFKEEKATLVDNDTHINISWTHSPIDDATGSNRYTINLFRSDDGGATWNNIKQHEISSNSITEGSYKDETGLHPNKTYIYQLRINLLGTEIKSKFINIKLGGSQLTGFTASRGEFNNVVKLAWTVRQVGDEETTFTIDRRPLGTEGEQTGWANIHTVAGTNSSYSYDDVNALPGAYNEYRLAIVDKDDHDSIQTYLTTDGFTYSTGVISGTVTYGTGSAVQDVKVKLKQQNDDGGLSSAGMHSLQFRDYGAGVAYHTDNEEIKQLFGGDFTAQMWVKPLKEEMGVSNENYIIFDAYYVFTAILHYNKSDNTYSAGAWLDGANSISNIRIPSNEWSHITVTHKVLSTDSATTNIIVATGDTIMKAQVCGKSVVNWTENALMSDAIAVGNGGQMTDKRNYRGYMDEIRFFTRALSEEEVLRNYNHPLVGNENGLAIYYPFDEGLAKQNVAYDYSKTNGVANGRHAMSKIPAFSSTNVPPENMLCMMNYTDSLGNYTIRGIHFQGDGTAYSVIPEYNGHDFSPLAKSCFVSQSSLVHSGIDFEDVSSFPVSGTIYYAGTTYPVEGVTFYVDGNVCAKNGEVIKSAANGTYTISVPIGKHFIQARMNGHVFLNNGRYPADPDNTGQPTFVCDRPTSGLDFFDQTLVNFTGRVVGGDIEGSKPTGFGQSVNNIGVTEFFLKPVSASPYMNAKDDGSYNDVEVPIASSSVNINSTSWRGAGDPDESRKLYIQTDPQTGEFSAMVPPLEYIVSQMQIKKTGDIVGDATYVDLSNPLLEESDTLYYSADSYDVYTYNKKLNQTFHSTPKFTVTQDGRDDGSFGIDTYTISDANGELTLNDLYSVGANGVTYTHGGAIFVMQDNYTFHLKGYEEYVNPDKTPAETSTVPLAGSVVTINNALSSQQSVYGENNEDNADPGTVADLQPNQLELDDEGCAIYKWKAGLPNITWPHLRTISMKYDINGRSYDWNNGQPLYGVILGSMPTGNNFVTAGPDMLDMVLRDPPGTGSSMEWTHGSVHSVTHSVGGTWTSHEHVLTTTKFGTSQTIGTGIGAFTLEEIQNKADMEIGVDIEIEGEDATTWGRTITNTKTITTSSEPDYVGADGDVFIGSSTNIVYGMARNLDLRRQGTGNTAALSVKDAITTGLQFNTEFYYTQKYIRDELIPHYEQIRNDKLQQVSSTVNYVNNGDKPIYITTLSPDDIRFGSSNHDKDVWGSEATPAPSTEGPSYTMVVPYGSEESYEDSLEWCNCQIRIWKNHLATNERMKVEAYNHRGLLEGFGMVKNHSFDAGSSVNISQETESHSGRTYDSQVTSAVHVGTKFGFSINDTGVLAELSTETGGGKHWQDEEDDADTNSFSYTLAEEGSDAISVDVYDFDNYSPIFRTRAGQTSNPYEGEVRTEFYEENGTHPVIMEATMQIEVPTISVDWADVSDVPTGAAANYTIHLGNQSEVGADVAYKLFVIDETNPDGAQISIDGMVLTEGRLIKVPGNQSLTKTLQLRQTNAGILDYFGNANPNSDLYQKGIGIVFASESQPEDIADTIFITARFIPSSSPVTLALSTTTMNTSTGTKLTLTIKDFDRNYVGLKAFRLQYKKPGDTDWIQLHEYVLNQSDLDQSGGNELLPSGGSVSYLKDLASFTDGSYQFRVVSAATYGLEEVYCYSDELTFVKDTQKPRPIGTPEPADGVLDIGDELSVTFNETILKDLLTKINNFKVTGVLNGAEIAHETALNLDGGSSTVAAAQTEADINLASKDFSIDTWVNITGAGTLLSHGKGSNKLTVSTDDNNKLVVNIAGNSYTSLNSVPTDDWAFLSMNVTADGKLNATAATANETVNLFADELVAPYTGNGPLSVGCGSDAALHELLLWDEAHDMTTALMNRSKTKNPSTRHLIGYWKMDEGEGKEIRDYSRNRNMTMPNETWYLNNENKAVTLDGENYVSITTAALNLFKGDDYAVEFWMRGGEQTGEAQLMQMGDVALWTSADGDLMLTGKEASLGAAQQTSNLKTQASNLLDNAWHHIALNVLRQGAAAVYVDGKRCLTTSSANMGDINGDKMIVGARRISNYENGESTPASYTFDRVFKGTVDEIRVWGATMNGDQLSKNRKVRFTGSEPGLIAYYPFETKTTDEYHQEVTNGTPEDLTGSGLQAQLLTVNAQLSAFSYSDDAPALRTKPTETNVNFTYTASDNKIVIELDEDAATIEGCTLNFTVRDLSDVNGNYSMPAVWSAFVNRKELVWAEDVLSVEQPMNTGSSVTATLVNKGGKQQMWTLSGLPSWMTADSEYGQANPLEEKTVTLNILPTAPLGRHEVTIYVTGNDNINVPLTLNVKVTGEEPLWTVNAGDYEETMNVFGSLMIVDVPSQDEDDIIGAFVNNECRGVSHLTYNKRYDGYFMMMDIYGNGSDANNDVVFKVYDASTGTIYPVVNTYATLTPEPESVNIKFVSNNLWGTLKDPVFLCATDTIEQNIELGKGWNWISFSVKPKVMTTNTVFANADGLITIIKSQAKNDQYYESYGAWYINMALNNREMYALNATEPFTLSVTGQRVNPADEPISFNKNWNWIGYNGQRVISLSEALTSMSPVTGDLIKGQRGVAYYDEYEWVGSMGTLKPGQGYKAKNTTSESRTFTYPPSAANITAVHQARRTFDDETATPRVFHPVDYRNYPANMVLIARVVRNGMPLADAELGVFAGSECREAVVTDGQGMVYITIPGDAATKLTFRVAADGEVFNCSESLNYETDAVVGTPRAPFVIDLAQATGITELDYRTISTSDNCYDLQGRRIDSSTFNVQRSTLKKGVYIINGQKQVK